MFRKAASQFVRSVVQDVRTSAITYGATYTFFAIGSEIANQAKKEKDKSSGPDISNKNHKKN